MRIYISGKITGLDNYRENFDRIERILKSYGHEVVNPCRVKDIYDFFTWDDFMDVDMCMIRRCDAVYFMENWKSSRGATMEHEYAKQLKKETIYEGTLHE